MQLFSRLYQAPHEQKTGRVEWGTQSDYSIFQNIAVCLGQ